jgi:hypothetical protein
MRRRLPAVNLTAALAAYRRVRCLDMRRRRAHDAPMRTEPGAARWGRLLLAALLVVLLPLAADLVADGVWVADLSEQAVDDDGLRPLASADPVGSAAALPAPIRTRVARLSLADDPVAESWTGLTSTDRAPPRA